MARRNRIIIPDYPHHIVQRGHNRQKIFRNNDDHHLYLQLLTTYLEKYECGLMAYCLMPNHVHLILRPPDRQALIKVLHGVGFRYAMLFNQAAGRTDALWMSRYYSSVIAEERYLWRAAQYIHLNPVRAGIVKHPCDYDWSSARILMLGEMNGVPVQKWLQEEQRPYFSNTILEPDEQACLYANIKRCLPYASAEGFSKLSKLTGINLLPKPQGAPKGRRKPKIGTAPRFPE